MINESYFKTGDKKVSFNKEDKYALRGVIIDYLVLGGAVTSENIDTIILLLQDAKVSMARPKDNKEVSLTTGEKLVGKTFNPSSLPSVDKAKELCAELVNMVEIQKETCTQSDLSNTLYSHTLGEILNAQMNVVKFLTFKN